MEFLSPITEEIRDTHQIEHPNFPWEFAYQKTDRFEEMWNYDPQASSTFEYTHTEEFSLYLNLRRVFDATDLESSYHLQNIINGPSFSWEPTTSKLLYLDLLRTEIFYCQEYTYWASTENIRHERLHITFKGIWAMFLLPKGYKLDAFIMDK